MSLKILGGSLKGLNVEVYGQIRPTSVMLRRRLFDWRQNLAGWNFIDLCAGSGAIGLEALSRNATKVTWVENNHKVFKTLISNTTTAQKKLNTTFNKDQIQNTTALKFLENLKLNASDLSTSSTILFLDPPYSDLELYKSVIEMLTPWFTGEIWVESDRQKGISEKELSRVLTNIRPTFYQGTNFIFIGRLANSNKGY